MSHAYESMGAPIAKDHNASLAAVDAARSASDSAAASHDAPKMRPNVLVYISGPMTANDGRTIEQNTADGVAVYLDLLQRGIPAFSPHLSGAFPSAWSALTHQQWIDYDLAVIGRCTHMLMMNRWKKSKGACMEFEYALNCRVPIAFSMDELIALLAKAEGRDRQPSSDGTSGSLRSAAQKNATPNAEGNS